MFSFINLPKLFQGSEEERERKKKKEKKAMMDLGTPRDRPKVGFLLYCSNSLSVHNEVCRGESKFIPE